MKRPLGALLFAASFLMCGPGLGQTTLTIATVNNGDMIRMQGLTGVFTAKNPDITLEPNDILFVPLSGAKVAAARSLEAAMAITTGLAIYAVHP